ncbi:MAG TPA: hypothetical protein VGZ90_13535 [Puia sp.]|jgi:hypothetical protein|nr:hypothetical protein [Puia sp.]
MNKFKVVLELIVGYYDENYEEPKLRRQEYEVMATDERDAINQAKQLDKTSFSIWDTYADIMA